jgi:hypothetical protein
LRGQKNGTISAMDKDASQGKNHQVRAAAFWRSIHPPETWTLMTEKGRINTLSSFLSTIQCYP